jgi:hypothetical protein
MATVKNNNNNNNNNNNSNVSSSGMLGGAGRCGSAASNANSRLVFGTCNINFLQHRLAKKVNYYFFIKRSSLFYLLSINP